MGAVRLRKGNKVSLEKGLTSLRVELTWNESTRRGETFDPDVMAVELYDKGTRVIDEKHFVFYGSPYLTKDGKLTDPESAVVHSGDDRDGSGDGEEMIINFRKLNPNVGCVTFIVNIYEAIKKNQTFSCMKNAVIRAFKDNEDQPTLVYELDESYGNCTYLIFCSVVKKENGSWEFVAEGDGGNGTLSECIKQFGIDSDEDDI